MRRHVATLVAAALLLSMAGPAVAADPAGPSPDATPAPEVSPAPDPTAAPEPEPTSSPEPPASQKPTASPEASLEASPDPTIVPRPRPSPGVTTRPAAAAPPSDSADPTGRWIVVYRNGTDVAAATARQAKLVGFTADRTFSHAFRGMTARLSSAQVRALRNDPAVLEVVPDEKIELAAQVIPTGIDRIDGRKSGAARIDGVDQRVDADVAIVDTGIAKLADLNVAGGYNCSTSDRTLWRDVHGHGTHVAGTVGAIDNATGVVGVAPGVRLWAVKILDDSGAGLLSWYVCGLDWIAAQRDPANPSRPRFESVNMSVTKWGRDDGACGATNADILHAAICRLVSSGVTVVAAAANDSGSAAARVPAAYNEVITVSALADTDGKPGATGGKRCFSWGSYDDDDSFANFSNYGSDIDLIAPGKCIWSTVPGGYQYMSGTSMAAPHVTGAVALLKATRPLLTPAEVKEALQYLGTLDWKITSDPDPTHEKLLNVSRLGVRGDFTVVVGRTSTVSEAGGTAVFPVSVTRSATSFERIVLSADQLPPGIRASFSTPSLYGFGGGAAAMTVTVPAGTRQGSYNVKVVGTEHGLGRSATATVVVAADAPVAKPPTADALPRGVLGAATIPTRVVWPAAVDPTSPIGGYEIQASIDGGAWGATTARGPTSRFLATTQTLGHAYRYRVRARDTSGTWSAWATGNSYTATLVEDSSRSVGYRGTWVPIRYARASGGNAHYAVARGASAKVTFVGRAVGFIAPVGPTRGSARIYWDGVYRTTISFKAPKGSSRLVMYSIGSATLGTHTLEVRLVGNGRVDVDAFVAFR
jgi:subtilisin family serine protease